MMPSLETKRDFEKLSETIRNVGVAASKGARLDAIGKQLGVQLKRRKIKFTGAGELLGKMEDTANAKRLPFPYQAALIGQLSLYGGLHQELNKHLRRERRINVQEVISDSRSSESRAGDVAAEILVHYDSDSKISYDRFKRKIEIRKVGKYKSTGDRIHLGASKKFRRYAITRVTLPVRGQVTAGRKGTELQGLGLEPVGTHPKSSASYPSDKYKAFIRRQYPGRAAHDTLITSYRFPVYTQILNDQALRRRVMAPVKKNLKAFASQWKRAVVTAVIDSIDEVDRKIKNTR